MHLWICAWIRRGECPLQNGLQQHQNRICTEVIKNYGEESGLVARLVRAIVAQRTESPIDTTLKLAQLVAQNVRTRAGQDPATRTFQAVRIFINRELEEVEAVLPQVMGRLKQGGRLAGYCVPFA